ncbi:MAG: TetR/AcrR family transcriptional regulator [Myxococcota bacterium]
MAKPRSAPRGVRIPQQARSRRTREKILQTALACFEEHGYDETTTAAIARRARIAVGTLYGYFADKRDILLEVLDRTQREVADYVVRGLDPELWREGDLRESVRRLIDAVFHARTVSPGIQRIIWERYFKDPAFRSAVESIEREVLHAIERLLVILKSEGRLRVDDVATAAFLIHTATEWTGARLMLGDSKPEGVDAAVEAATDMITRFLFSDPTD